MERDLQAWLSGPVHAWRCAGTDFIVATGARFACSVVFLHRICSVHEKGREGIKKESLALCLPVQKGKDFAAAATHGPLIARVPGQLPDLPGAAGGRGRSSPFLWKLCSDHHTRVSIS
jgi:hypothetical protein